ncbi:hypothetical protein GCM10010401_10120 [Rarobacter faecitabidus]
MLLGTIVPAAASPSGEHLADDRGLGARLSDIVAGTYESVAGRLQPSGYAATSLTGEYEGMYARDASIQSLAMLKAGQTDASRSILKYLIDYGTAKNLERAPRHLPAEEYVAAAAVPALSGNPDLPVSSFMGLTDSALLKINGPSNGAALSFTAPTSAVTKVKLGLLAKGTSGTTTVTIRAARDWGATALASATVSNATFYSSADVPSWVTFDFGAGASLTSGQTYYITMQSTAEPSGSIVQWWGNQGGGSGSTRTYNFDSGNWASNPIPGRGAYQLFTAQGAVGGQDQADASRGLFQVQGPAHQAAQSFTLADQTLTSVWIPVSSQSDSGTLRVSVRTDRTQAGTQVAQGTADLSGVGTSKQWIKVPLTLDSGATVSPGTTYSLVVGADVADPAKQVVWHGAGSTIAAVGAGWNYDSVAYGGWHAEDKSLAFAVNSPTAPASVGPRYTTSPATKVTTIGGDQRVTQTFTADQTLTGLDVFLGTTAVDGDVQVTIADSTNRTSQAVIEASELTAEGGWHRLRFSTLGLPTNAATGDGTYRVTLAAPDSAAGSVDVYGVPGSTVSPGISASRIEGSSSTALSGTLALQPLSLVYSGEQMTDQPDGNYMLISAWSTYVEANPGDQQFIADTYPTIKRWADNYWDTSKYVNTSLKLIYDPEFEHSLRSWHIPTYDLITNVFASQALHQLSAIAEDIPGEASAAHNWGERSTWLTEGINENLTAIVDGKKIYAELYWLGPQDSNPSTRPGLNDARDFKVGYSWVNLAPVAANWYATDWEIMENTYDAYLEYGSVEWENTVDSQKDLMLKMDSIEDTWQPRNEIEPQIWRRHAVIGKGLGWEYTLAAKLGRADRLATMNHFLETQTPGDVLGEFYYKQGPSDVGNQEQSSWWLIGILNAFPRSVTGQTPVISGEARAGQVLSVQPGTWTDGTELTYEWFADGATVAGATAATFTPTANEVGKRITVAVTGTKPGYEPATLISDPTATVLAAKVDPEPPATPVITAGKLTITGSATVGKLLVVNPGTWSPSATRLTYQWLANGAAVEGATSTTLSVPASVVGKRISVRVTGTYPRATQVTATSASTAATSKGKLVHKKVKITGKTKAGKKLRAKLAAWGPAPVKLTYRWYAGAKRIKGATKKTLKVKKAHRGKKITVKVTGSKAGYVTKTVTSKAKRIRR